MMNKDLSGQGGGKGLIEEVLPFFSGVHLFASLFAGAHITGTALAPPCVNRERITAEQSREKRG